MQTILNRRLALGLLMSAMMVASGAAGAQEYPTRPITMVVPFAPGNTTDANARLVARELSETLGQPVVVENMPGANGNVASASVARSKPDGYTIMISGIGTHSINQAIYETMPVDTLNDFTHLAMIASGANAIAVLPGHPANSLGELIEIARQNPGTLSYATGGNGSSGNMAFEMLKQLAGIEIEHIPYKGGGTALTDVLGGQVPIIVNNADFLGPYAKDGKLKILAVTSPERNPLLPDVPTVAESGYDGYSVVSWTGISGPKGLPDDVASKLEKAIREAVSGPLKSKLEAIGLTPDPRGSKEYTDLVAAETAKWKAVAQTAGIAVN